MEKKGKDVVNVWASGSSKAARGRGWFLPCKARCLGCILFVLSLVICQGCDDVQRHRVLTFFFEGVPPLDGEVRRSVISRRVLAGRGGFSQRSQGGGQGVVSAQAIGSRHEPVGNCNNCHTGRMGQGQLAEGIPDLCYSCHEVYRIDEGYPHGPVAVGACAFCHDPHQSEYVRLQRAPQPELCYQCHRREDMGTILGHKDKLETICTDCHDPHTSLRKKLLKPFDEWAGDPNDFGIEMKMEDDPNAVNISN